MRSIPFKLAISALVLIPGIGQADQILEDKPTDERRSCLGVLVWKHRSEILPTFVKFDVPVPVDGVFIAHVIPRTPAHRAGLQKLDIIYSIDDCNVTDYTSYVQCCKDIEPGTLVTLKIKRPIEGETPLRVHWLPKRVRVITIAKEVCDKWLQERNEQIEARQKQEAAQKQADAESKTTHGFRGVAWGASPGTVRKREPTRLTVTGDSDSVLSYLDERAAGFAASIFYFFVDGQLVEGSYLFNNQHTNATLFVSDYDSVKALITEKYTVPSKDETTWLNDLFRDDLSEWGTAIKIGHLRFQTTWELTDTIVSLQLIGDNYKVIFGLRYTSRKHQEMADRSRSKAKRDQF